MAFIEPAARVIRGHKIQMVNPPLFHFQLGQVKEDAAKALVPYTLRCSNGSKAHGIFINHPGAEPAYLILFIQDQQDTVLGPVMLHGQQAVALPSPAELVSASAVTGRRSNQLSYGAIATLLPR